MTDTETRNTSETGGQKGQKLPRLGGADAQALLELARVYGFGEVKYERYNYLKGYPFSWSIDAMLRHVLAFMAGEDRDPESQLMHTAHVAWHALALTAFVQRGIGTDDREPREHVISKDCWCGPESEEVSPRADLAPRHYGACEHGTPCADAPAIECDCENCKEVDYAVPIMEATGPITEFKGIYEPKHDDRQHTEGVYLGGCPRCTWLAAWSAYVESPQLPVAVRPDFHGVIGVTWRPDYEDGVPDGA